MKRLTLLEVFLIILGPIVLRPVFKDDYTYLFVCLGYGVFLGIGKMMFEGFD